ncbi:mediator of RNA polymerase II transcription subunit 34-like [Paramuricea clavata]|nr:mediator of RNA polymerase II transcription subunit 34-like [Paramuricea clavata]
MFAREDKSVLMEMLHSCTPEDNKKCILESFQNVNGTIRILVATIAFGMGVDCKAVHRVIHYGPSKTIEAYVQETGRAGRDGVQSRTFILYHGILLNHVDMNIKSFVKTKDCRRKTLLNHFEADCKLPLYLHLCCDNCASICECGQADCGQYTKYPITDCYKDVLFSGRKREVSNEQKKLIENALIQYQKKLLIELANTTAKAEIKTLTNIRLMLGFSEHQITQVLNSIDQIFTMSDVCSAVEIWDKRHAEKILNIINSVFGDLLVHEHLHDSRGESVLDMYEFDDELLDDWQEILQDNDMFDMIVENLSLSQLQDSLIDERDMSSDSQDEEIIVSVLK